MLMDLINLDKIRRATLYALIILLALFLQCEVFSRISPLGVNAMFIPVVVVAIGLFEGGVWGGVLGLLAGFLCDIFYHETTLLFTILLPVIGFFAGTFTAFFVNKRFVAFLVLSLVALAITALCQMFRLWVFMGADPIRLLTVGGLQTLWSLPFTIPVYFPSKALSKRKLY